MLNLDYVPTNEQLFRTQLKRPRFYALKNNPNTKSCGYIVPREVDGRLRWVTVNRQTGEITPVPLNELRNAHMYLEMNRKKEPQAAYLFVYVERGGEKRYYVVGHAHISTWLSQTLRFDMLSEEGAGSISSARNIVPLASHESSESSVS